MKQKHLYQIAIFLGKPVYLETESQEEAEMADKILIELILKADMPKTLKEKFE